MASSQCCLALLMLLAALPLRGHCGTSSAVEPMVLQEGLQIEGDEEVPSLLQRRGSVSQQLVPTIADLSAGSHSDNNVGDGRFDGDPDTHIAHHVDGSRSDSSAGEHRAGGREILHDTAHQKRSPYTWFGPVLVLPAILASLTYAYSREYHESVGRNAAAVGIVQMFLQNLTYTMVIPSSFDLARGAGLSAASSGTIISVHQLGVCLGSIWMWMLLQRHQLFSSGGGKPWWLMCFSASANLVGAVGFFAMTRIDALHAAKGDWFLAPILFSRLVDGVGTGITAQLGMMQIISCVPSSERLQWIASSQVAVMLGAGCGPLIASFASAIEGCGGGHAGCTGAGGAYIGVGLASLVSALAFYPKASADGKAEHGAVAPASAKRLAGGLFDLRIQMACIFLMMTALRSFVISGLEAATSLLLESQYGWGVVEIGYAVGGCFLLSGPVKVLYNMCQDCLTTQGWVRLYSVIATLASVLLFSGSCALFGYPAGGCATTIFLADAVLFPTLFLADALVAGTVVQSENALPADSWFAPNMLMLYRVVAVSGVGRGLAAPLARLIIVAGGRDAFALQQVVSTVLWLVLYEAFERLSSRRAAAGEEAAAEAASCPAAG